MEINKYRITDNTIKHDGHIIHRIQALKDFGNVKKGEVGGLLKAKKIFLKRETVGFMVMLL